ncbi:MAG: hypothetical protein N4A38_00680 [Candidatus Gracilibacteria bacterium]|jgi:hypothetical protein|nr:hypothetical protein [Candidatus Gracilibacteria bacterium]
MKKGVKWAACILIILFIIFPQKTLASGNKKKIRNRVTIYDIHNLITTKYKKKPRNHHNEIPINIGDKIFTVLSCKIEDDNLGGFVLFFKKGNNFFRLQYLEKQLIIYSINKRVNFLVPKKKYTAILDEISTTLKRENKKT